MSEPVYTPNSHKYREQQKEAAAEEKRVQKVVKGPVKTKKNEVRKFADIFISEDVHTVKDYLFFDVIVPAVKKLVYDVVVNGFDTVLWGSNGRGKNGSNGAKVNYRNYYDQKNSNSTPTNYRGSENNRGNSGLDYDDIVFSNRGEAENVKQQLQDTVERYGMVTVADLYDLAGLQAPYTSQKYGWMDVSHAEVKRDRDGYTIKLPRAVPVG